MRVRPSREADIQTRLSLGVDSKKGEYGPRMMGIWAWTIHRPLGLGVQVDWSFRRKPSRRVSRAKDRATTFRDAFHAAEAKRPV